jgi:hypothetical protein
MKGFKVGFDASLTVSHQAVSKQTRGIPRWFWYLTALPLSFILSEAYLLFFTK